MTGVVSLAGMQLLCRFQRRARRAASHGARARARVRILVGSTLGIRARRRDLALAGVRRDGASVEARRRRA